MRWRRETLNKYVQENRLTRQNQCLLPKVKISLDKVGMNATNVFTLTMCQVTDCNVFRLSIVINVNIFVNFTSL